MCDINPKCDSNDIDQLGTCVGCGTHPNAAPDARRTGGAGARTQPLSDEEYRWEMKKLTGGL
jgi:hypothetical protein